MLHANWTTAVMYADHFGDVAVESLKFELKAFLIWHTKLLLCSD